MLDKSSLCNVLSQCPLCVRVFLCFFFFFLGGGVTFTFYIYKGLTDFFRFKTLNFAIYSFLGFRGGVGKGVVTLYVDRGRVNVPYTVPRHELGKKIVIFKKMKNYKI